jgi:hypothetical protein
LVIRYDDLPSSSAKMSDEGLSVIWLWRSLNSNVVTLENSSRRRQELK